MTALEACNLNEASRMRGTNFNHMNNEVLFNK